MQVGKQAEVTAHLHRRVMDASGHSQVEESQPIVDLQCRLDALGQVDEQDNTIAEQQSR